MLRLQGRSEQFWEKENLLQLVSNRGPADPSLVGIQTAASRFSDVLYDNVVLHLLIFITLI
jgi:hypothetical protein